MGLITIVVPDDQGTLTASSEGAGTVVANLWRTQPTDVWQADDAGSHWILQDRGEAVAFDTVALLYTNMSVGGTWRVRAASSEAKLTDGTAEYDSGTITFAAFHSAATTPRRHLYHRLPATQTLRYRRIDVTDESAPFTAGRLVIGLAWEPPWARYSLVRGFEPALSLTETDGGQTILERREGKPTIAFEAVADSMTDFEAHLFELERVSGEALIAYDAAGAHLQKRLYYGLVRGSGFTDEAFRFFKHRIELRGLL